MKVEVIGQRSRSPRQKYDFHGFCLVYLTMTWRSKVSRVKVKGHMGQGHMGQGQRSHGSRSKVIGQGQIRALYTVRQLH